jgi:hypothetical protein
VSTRVSKYVKDQGRRRLYHPLRRNDVTWLGHLLKVPAGWLVVSPLLECELTPARRPGEFQSLAPSQSRTLKPNVKVTAKLAS